MLPPLRERREDIALLAEYFLTYFSERLGVSRRTIAPDAVAALVRHTWPGNIRELMNVIESSYTFARTLQITVSDLPAAITLAPAPPRVDAPSMSVLPPSFVEAERDLIARALAATGGNKLQAAKLLGISRKKLYAKIAKYRLAEGE